MVKTIWYNAKFLWLAMWALPVHWFRLLVEERNDSFSRWQVIYDHNKSALLSAGYRSLPMCYREACSYADVFGGKVVRYKRDITR